MGYPGARLSLVLSRVLLHLLLLVEHADGSSEILMRGSTGTRVPRGTISGHQRQGIK